MLGIVILGINFNPLTSLLAFIIWVAIAFWPARVAGRKGHSFFGYFLLSLLFFPLALIIAYMLNDRYAHAAAQAAPQAAPPVAEIED